MLIFEEGTDLLRARQLVSERVATAARSCPRWPDRRCILSPLSSMSRVLKIGLSSKTLDQIG